MSSIIGSSSSGTEEEVPVDGCVSGISCTLMLEKRMLDIQGEQHNSYLAHRGSTGSHNPYLGRIAMELLCGFTITQALLKNNSSPQFPSFHPLIHVRFVLHPAAKG